MITVKNIYLSRHGNKRSRLTRKCNRVIAFVIILATIGLLSVGAYSYFNVVGDKDNAEMMRQGTASLANEIKLAYPETEWKNDSFCTIVRPRSFGDGTKYSCTAEYESSKPVTNQDEINTLVNSYREVLESNDEIEVLSTDIVQYPIYTADDALLSEPGYEKLEQISAMGFELENVKTAKCNIKHELNNGSKMSVEISSKLTCYLDTQKAYYDPIRYI